MDKETVRVAIYTRKSVEEGLEQEFNSLEAQREAVENYIASQKCNGLTALPKHYDDGGYTGANTNRPALKELMADIDAGGIDMVAVYKIDRLSRSLLDFAELFRHFEEKNVKFLAATQQIDTSTPSGRMTLNILMTFAQYEREMTSDRIRDKVSASKRKGMWMGGKVPFGYRSENKKLVIDPERAGVVRQIYEMYLECSSTGTIARELNRGGFRTSTGGTWCGNSVAKILANPVYKGFIEYRGTLYRGEHAPLLAEELWEQVARARAQQLGDKKEGRPYNKSMAPLKGILKCGHCGGAMTPSTSVKHGVRYAYYTCSRTAKSLSRCPYARIPAAKIEEAVFAQIMALLKTDTVIGKIADEFNETAPRMKAVLSNITDFWDMFFPAEKQRIVSLLVTSAVLKEDSVDIRLNLEGAKKLVREMQNEILG